VVSKFLSSILPPEGMGYRVAATFINGLGSPPTHSFYKDSESLSAASIHASAQGWNFYHACATYSEPTNRKGANVAFVKSLWVDLDVGANKPYATKQEAVAAYFAFSTTLGLPTPWVVSSGFGIHIYHPFEKPVTPDRWDKLAASYAACMDHFGVKHDTSRTQDKASILRTPGTFNYKRGNAGAVPVKVLKEGVEQTARSIWDTLDAYIKANGLIPVAPVTGKIKASNDLIGAPKDYPPSEGERVAKRCAALNEVESTGGDVSYDIWWRALGVAKHTTKPDEVAAHWTRHRAETGHDKSDSAATMAAWNAGPTTCAEFSKHCGQCSTCPHFGKITSPIQLGSTDELPVKTITLHKQLVADDGDEGGTFTVTVPQLPGTWGFKTEWVVTNRCRGTHTGLNEAGQMTRVVKSEAEDGESNFKHVPFCDRYWQVTRRIRDIDGKWKLEITYETYPGKPPQSFLFDSASVLVPDSIRKEFSAREIHIYGGKTSIDKASNLLMFDQELLRGYQQEAVTYPTMGWVTQNNSPTGVLTGDFVIGDMLYSKGKQPTQVLLSESVPDVLREGFRTSGSTAEWVRLVNHIYNRPKAQPYQFIIAAMFASPLVKLVPGGGEWHGVPIGIGGDSAAAKTTTALVAASIYTNGQALKFNADPKNGDTLNALAIKVGALRNIPVIMDELTNSDPDRVSSILFMMANGQPKDRATQTAQLVNNPYRWDMTSLVTSNDNLHDVLENAHSKDAQNAAKLRLFQINLRKSDLSEVFPDINKTLVEETLLGNQYGMVGRDWLQFIVNNQVKIQNLLSAARATYNNHMEDSSTRFYRDLILVTYIAAKLAKQRGFIQWDVEAMREWAEANLLNLRLGINTGSWENDISDFIASLNGRTIVTKIFREGRGRRISVEQSMAPISPNVIPVARRAIDDSRFFVVESYLREWCKARKLLFKQMVEEMVARGYLKHKNGTVATPRINIGNGTDVSRSRATCLEFEYAAVSGYEPEQVHTDNVIELRPGGSANGSSDDDATGSVAANP
jgi:Domain of unknown function (DUF927)